MSMPSRLYRPSLSLLTDLYQLTMAYAAWRTGWANREAVFHLFFRKNPFNGGFAIACGLDYVVDYLSNFHFDDEDLAYLSQIEGPGGGKLFDQEFLQALREMPLALDVDAIPEGTVVFPHEPLLRVQGPIIACMLAETPLLNMINFQTLIATKAARIAIACKGEPLLDFGLRRAQGIDGALTASRAAFIGGCSATSNVLAGRLWGIPVRGTHAHSWVMLFDGEQEAFKTYARALPHNCVFLVDTYDTLDGVRHAIEVGRTLCQSGHQLYGIRLDSGDLAQLSIQARALLDDAGFKEAKIFATNDLDEHVIASLKEQGASIAIWGVGTRLVTAFEEPALGGVYKLSAVRQPAENWRYRIKISEQTVKVSTPGILQVRRFYGHDEFLGDVIYDQPSGWPNVEEPMMVDPVDPTRMKKVPHSLHQHTDLLVPVLREGKPVYQSPAIAEIQQRARSQLSMLPVGVKRFLNPHQYPVGLEQSLHDLKVRLILEARKTSEVSSL